ncbi:hypothetical protein CSB09_03110 [Candidatus Gracilibacteria bacterium]|nr:MAG: hypothetical protein CSB09_03110 [Candidatus Gracilibacteria bacterium]
MKNNLFFNISLILLLVLYPLFFPGYMFSLDQSIGIRGWIPNFGDNIFWLGYVAKLFFLLGIPVWLLQKVVIIGSFFLAVLGGYLLSKKWNNYFASFFLICFLIFNPFLYGRFIDGQINIYLSYLLYPLFFYFLRESFEKGGVKNIFSLSFFSLFLCLTSLHNAIFLFFIGIIFATTYIFSTQKYKNIIFSGLGIGFLNLFYFIPLIFSSTQKGALFSQISSYGNQIFEAFATDIGTTNLYFNVLSLHGYWGERMHRFLNVWEYNPFWWFIFLVIFSLVLYGIFQNIKEKNTFGVSLFILAIFSYIFTLGISEQNIFSSLNSLLYEYFPFYAGFREPQKWTIFLVIAYAYFGGYGILKLQDNILFKKLNKKSILIFILSFLPILYIPGVLSGFGNQIIVKEYPKSWYDIKKHYKENENVNCKYFNKTKKCYSSVVFPWHSYMSFGFLENKKTLISITSFFGNNLLSSDNIEIGDVYSFSQRFESKIIEKYIFSDLEKQKNNAQNFIQELKKLGIEYIFFFKEADYKKYEKFIDFMLENNLLKIKIEKDGIVLYTLK